MAIILKSWNTDYPFSKEISEQYDIIYHATNSNFAESIETHGWYENSQAYDINHIRYLCDTCDKLFVTDILEYDIPNELKELIKYYTYRIYIKKNYYRF